MKAESKSFKSVEDDYLFFEQCVDEIDRTLEIWRPRLAQLDSREKPLRILDFGCGRGSFTLRAVQALDLPPDQISIILLDPATEHVEKAVKLLGDHGFRSCKQATALAAIESFTLDVIWTHHVLYYVPDLEAALREMRRCLRDDGLFLCAVSGEKSAAGMLQQAAFSTAGIESPYRSGVEVCQTIVQEFEDCVVEPYQVRIEMKDSLKNRESLLRFLVGEYHDRVDWPRCLALFDNYSDGKTVRIPSDELSIYHGADGNQSHTFE